MSNRLWAYQIGYEPLVEGERHLEDGLEEMQAVFEHRFPHLVRGLEFEVVGCGVRGVGFEVLGCAIWGVRCCREEGCVRGRWRVGAAQPSQVNYHTQGAIKVRGPTVGLVRGLSNSGSPSPWRRPPSEEMEAVFDHRFPLLVWGLGLRV